MSDSFAINIATAFTKNVERRVTENNGNALSCSSVGQKSIYEQNLAFSQAFSIISH